MNTKNKQVDHKYKRLLRQKKEKLSISPLNCHFANTVLAAVLFFQFYKYCAIIKFIFYKFIFSKIQNSITLEI